MVLWLAITAASLALSPARATPVDTGVWRGTLAGRRDTAQVRLLLEHDARRWQGRLRVCRGAHAIDYALDSVRVDTAAARADSVPVSFLVRRMAGHPRFAGAVSWDDHIVGTLRTGRRRLALSVVRAAAAEARTAERCAP